MREAAVEKPQIGPRRIIERPRLTRLLDESPARIKLLVAPAGYGKTTLARQWLAASRAPAAWLCTTPACVDVAALAMGVHRAVSGLKADIGRILVERLAVSPNPQAEVEVLADVLTNDIGAWPEVSWLVIDDYQEIVDVAAAERFIEILLLRGDLNVLVLTRERPSWASARRILYGEISELGRDTLAMNRDEAAMLLARGDPSEAGILEASGGWPAVLALAALSSPAPRGLTMESGLYRFFVEELYQRIDLQTRHGLWKIALVAPLHRDFLTDYLGSVNAARTVDLGCNAGFLNESQADTIEIHPLLRGFLEDELRQEPLHSVRALVEGAFCFLLKRELWDEAFELISRFEFEELLSRLIKASLKDLLELGRTETLRRWISRGEGARC